MQPRSQEGRDPALRQSRVPFLNLDSDEVSLFLERSDGRRATSKKAVQDDISRVGQEPYRSPWKLGRKLGFVVVIGSHGRKRPDPTRAPLLPLVPSQPTTIKPYNPGFPEKVQILELINGSVGQR